MEQDPENPNENICKGLQQLTNVLLENATAHSKNWQRVTYEVPGQEVATLYERMLESPAFRQLIIGPGQPVPNIPDWYGEDDLPIIASELPEQVLIGAERSVHTYDDDDEGEEHLKLSIVFVHQDSSRPDVERPETAQVSIHCDPSTGKIHRIVNMWRYAETGYEGHGFETVEASPADLEEFLRLCQETTGDLVEEKPMMEWLHQLFIRA